MKQNTLKLKSKIKLSISYHYKEGYEDENMECSYEDLDICKKEIEVKIKHFFHLTGTLPNIGDVFSACESNFFFYIKERHIGLFNSFTNNHISFVLDDWNEHHSQN